MKIEIDIEIENIVVEERYFSFDYKVTVNGKIIKNTYGDKYAFYNKDEFEKVLKDKRAYSRVLDEIDIIDYL